MIQTGSPPLPTSPSFVAAKELQAIIEASARAAARGEPSALATVVKTSGSTYRHAGARMWIGANGEVVGSISGGCLEDDARDRAGKVIASGQPALIHYDTTDEGDILWGSGVGCQGVVRVLIQPLPGRVLKRVADSLRKRTTMSLATVFRVGDNARAALGEFLWCAGEGMVESDIAHAGLAAMVRREALRALRMSAVMVRIFALPDGGEAEVFIDVIQPPRSLLILGAGHDAIPLARLAGELGRRVRVADRRRAYAIPARFPDASEVVHCAATDVGTDRLPIETDEAVVVMTHNYIQDLAVLRALLPTRAGYIGLLGPSRRKEMLLEELKRSTPTPAWLNTDSLRRIHGPAGLDIGAEAPEQIALSILAEIQAYETRRRGGPLRHRREPLHDIVPESAPSTVTVA